MEGCVLEKGHLLLQLLYALVEKIERSSTQYTPLSAVYLVEYLAERIEKKLIPIVCFQSSTTSHICLSDLIALSSSIAPSESQELEEDVIFLSLPYSLKNDPLSYCIASREFALYLLKSGNHLETVSPKGLPGELVSVAADRLAALMFGPAYLFSLLSSKSPSTPEGNLRLQGVVFLLVEEGYCESRFLAPLLPPLGEMSPAKVELFRKIEKDFKETRAYYPPEIFKSEVPQLVSRILDLLPPNEVILPDTTTLPAEIPSIVNAGWIVKKDHMPAFYKLLKAETLEDRHQAKRKLDALIEKAIELSVIHRSLREAES
ncbi:MAG: hypothetical protein QW461_04300 [Candidatus Jordarchaeales archaeon]